MGWRTVVVTKPSKLDLKLGYLVVRDSETSVRIHLSEISLLIVETTRSSITTALLNELVKQKIKTIFCDEKQNPSSELMPCNGSYHCSAKIREQIKWQDHTKQLIWTCIVAEKIRKQAENLKYFEKEEAEKLYGYLDELELNDASNREGHAAKVYFNALFGKSFSRSEECTTNAALNYGYSIVLSCVNREVVCNGYITQLGLFHDNMFNPFNLSCDLMEPFRPIIDGFVKKADFCSFDTAEKREMLTLLNQEFTINERKETLLNTIRLYVRSAFNALETGDASCIKTYYYEL